ncbi:protein kinase domain-containing protein [Nannocystaceae bacterium ST9]
MSRRFGQYELTRLLGSGGMGEVWGAVKLGMVGGVQMPCAIKLMHPQFAETEAARERFLNEARIAAQLDHGRIVKVIDVGEIAGTLYLVMDRVDGVDLRTFLGKFHEAGGDRLSQPAAVFIVAEILAALSYAHNRTIRGESAAVIHHDVTPGNLMISSSGEVKLTDFGIARFAAEAGWVSRPMGTVRYMAPEMFLGDFGRPASDIYQLGVILHELLDGRRYLAECDGDTFKRRIFEGGIPRLVRTDVPHWLDQLRVGMLTYDANQRPTARAALNMILRNSSAHAGAGEELRRLYEQLVGDSRSGFTEFLQAIRDEPSTPSSPKPDSPTSRIAPDQATVREREALWLEGSEGPTKTAAPDFSSTEKAEKTELLPPLFPDASPQTGEPATVGHEVSSAIPLGLAPPAARPSRRGRLLIGTMAGAIGVLLILLIASLNSDRSSGPTDEAPTGPATQESSRSDSDPSAVSVAGPSSADSPRQSPSEPKPAEPTIEVLPPQAPTLPIEATPSVADEPLTPPKPETEPASKPKPAAPKMAVILTIDKVKDGEIKVRSKIHPYKYSATVWLTPGRYPVAWRATGKTDWTSAGTLAVQDIGTDTYSVVLRDGSLDLKRTVRKKN